MSQVGLCSSVSVNQNKQIQEADTTSRNLRIAYGSIERIGVYGVAATGTAVGVTTAAVGLGMSMIGVARFFGFRHVPIDVYGEDAEIDAYDRIIASIMYTGGAVFCVVGKKIVASSVALASSMMRESSQHIKKD